MVHPLGLVDGRIIDLQDCVAPLEDRGYQFGDGVYELTRVYHGKCFAFCAHMGRLFRSLRELGIPATFSITQLAEFHQRLIDESGINHGSVYLQITRGIAPRSHCFTENMVPKLTMSIRAGGPVNAESREFGVKVISTPDERWLRCDIKSLNLLGNILAKQKAKAAGCYEAVLVRGATVTEGASSNFFIVKDGVIWTHPLNNFILQGITRGIILENLALQMDMPVLEKEFGLDLVLTAEEAFLSGTNTEIMPVTSVNGVSIGKGNVGDVTRNLQKRYHMLVDNECL